jgi:hypothetical protein
MALCVIIEMQNVRFRTVGQWIYNDQEKCSNRTVPDAPMTCYFPQAEPICQERERVNQTATLETFDIRYNFMTRSSCPHTTRKAGGYSNVRAATTEYLFTRVSDIVQAEGERQLNLLFPRRTDGTAAPSKVPKQLITVHIRWGDKRWEMKFQTIDTYIKAVQQILDDRQEKRRMLQHQPQQRKHGKVPVEANDNVTNVVQGTDDQEVHIYLATEDPKAYNEFMKRKPSHWHVYVDQYYIEMLPYRTEHGPSNVHVYAAEGPFHGRNGLIALGSLLVAMEANDFVLTTASNWSRLINEIRKNIIDPRCNNCTLMIDLLHDEI